jgi:hypothetical protein
MTLRIPGPAIGLVLALGSAAGCGGEEMFLPELGTNERLVGTEAFARIAKGDEGVEDVVVVGDLDGDGIDDAVIRTAYLLTNDAGNIGLGSAVYVVYGGPGVTGKIDMATLPTLVHTGAFGGGVLGGDVIPVGDIDGDGLADFMVGIARTPGCGDPSVHELGDNLQNGGAYIIYGNHTRLTGTHPIDDAGVFLRDPVPCTVTGRVDPLGDIDGDGKADFAVGRTMTVDGSAPSTMLVFYGRSPQLTGTVDLTTTADAVITNAARPQDSPIGGRMGDVDGDGVDDFVVVTQTAVDVAGNTMDVRLVRGSATRLSGTHASEDLGVTQFLVHTCISPPEVAALGDLDGDGVDDFALSGCVGGSLGELTKDYHLFYGRKGGFPAQVGADDQDATLPTSHTGPSQLAGGDADGDGIPDLILADVGLHAFNGAVHVMRGRAGVRLSGIVDPVARSFVTYVGETVREDQPCQSTSCALGEALGWGGIAVGDVTGDHHVDLLMGATTSALALPAKGGPFDKTRASVYLVSPPASTNP